jgi:lysophospholipase L1-like esterase
MFFVGSLMLLIFVDVTLGRQGSIVLICSGVVALIGGLVFQITSQQSPSKLGRQILTSHKAVAIVTLNTLILFACLELAAAFVTKVWKEPVKMTDEDLPRAHTSYYASQTWAKQYWREFSLTRPELYRDYVIWRRAPFTGQFININRDGIRLTPGAVCGANSYKVFAFGGSTMWGTGSPDWGTTPAYLQADFNALKHGPVCVMNFGESAYVSTQSVIELEVQLQLGNVPDLVIFYDGVNDVYAAYQSGRPTHQNFDHIAAKLNNGESSSSFVAWIESSNSFHLFKRLVAELRKEPPNSKERVTYKTMGVDTATLSDSVVQTYLSNYQIVDALARKYGFKFFFFWQPVISIGDKPLTSEEQDMRRQMEPALIELYEAVYRRVQRVANEYENLYYIAEMFNSLDSGIWIDYAHVNPVGNRFIAEKIFGVITGHNLLDSNPAHDGPSSLKRNEHNKE